MKRRSFAPRVGHPLTPKGRVGAHTRTFQTAKTPGKSTGKSAFDSHYRQSIGDRLVVDGGVGGDCPRRTNRNGVGFDGWSWSVVVGLEVFFFGFSFGVLLRW